MLDLRIVLLGYKGAGMTSTGNTILGQEVFDPDKRTSLCVKKVGEVAGRQVTVVDTPGWRVQHSFEETPQLTKREIAFSTPLCSSGPHCLLLVLRLDCTFREVHRRAFKEHVELLGEGVWSHTVVLFTSGDHMGDPNIEQFIESEGEALQWLIDRCDNRYHVLNNKDKNNGTQVSELLEKIEEMVAGNRGCLFQINKSMELPAQC